MKEITMRYNLSINDARRNDYGAIHLFTAPGTTLQHVNIYQNTVFMSPGQNSAAALGVSFWSPGLREVRVINNSFITDGNTAFIDIPQAGNDIRFWGNNYDSTGDEFVINFDGQNYYSLADWRSATGQENYNGNDVGSNAPAGVVMAGGSAPSDYKLRPDSILVDHGLDLNGLFGLDSIQKDFFGNPVPARITYDIGMHELPADPPPPTQTPMPIPTPTATAIPSMIYTVYIPVTQSLP